VSFQADCRPSELDYRVFRGDTYSFILEFDFDVTGYDFSFVGRETVGGTPILDFSNSDIVIVAGDPGSVENSISLIVDSSGWLFDCVRYSFGWVAPSGNKRTVLVGNIFVDGG